MKNNTGHRIKNAKCFIKYRQKHSQIIDEYTINTNGKDALNINAYIRIYLILSNNYLYCMYELFDKQYIFKFKNRKAIDIFTKYHNPVNFNKNITYLFDYKNNENTTIVNGHCLKYFCGNHKNITAIQCIYTYDTESCLNLICTDINEITAGCYIQETIGKFKELKYYNIRGCLWDITNNIPEALKDLVISQKVMLSMLAK